MPRKRKVRKKKSSKGFLKNILIVCAFAAAFLIFSQKVSLGSLLSGVSASAGETLYKYEDTGSVASSGALDVSDSQQAPAESAGADASEASLFGDTEFDISPDPTPTPTPEPAPAPDPTPTPAPAPTEMKIDKVEDNSALASVGGVLGINDVSLQPETDLSMFSGASAPITIGNLDQLRDLNYLRNNFYTVDKATALTSADFNVDNFINTDLKIDNSVDGPKVLIFHTHSQEMYADSDPSSLMDGVVGVGQELADILENKYGIQCLHDTGTYDVVDGVHTVLGAYERMEPNIEKILADNPSIQVAIDIHRDGIPDDEKLVTTQNGVQMAQVMFFNGLCKLNDENGVLQPIDGLASPYIQTNLAMSFMAELTANQLYPDFARKIYLNAYRYSENMLPKSMLIEVGAQTNTKQEALNAMGPLADVLASVIN